MEYTLDFSPPGQSRVFLHGLDTTLESNTSGLGVISWHIWRALSARVSSAVLVLKLYCSF